ncbi:DUF4142 domain-containing protein [Bradyrhizobium sp.]|uniref:DUF4142 domain-containing protein n=1 Tax=Bradyrhizobium sp. TaxID=376 RepID=UPI00403783B5
MASITSGSNAASAKFFIRASPGQRGPLAGDTQDGPTTNQAEGRLVVPALANACGKVKAELPTALDASHQSKLDKLKDTSGNDFSSSFNSMQVSAHKDAVDLFERYVGGGDNTDLKDWADKTLPALRHHLEMAQSLGKKSAPTVGEAGSNTDEGAARDAAPIPQGGGNSRGGSS